MSVGDAAGGAEQTTTSGGARGGIVPLVVLVVIVVAVGLGLWAIYTADPDLDTSVIGTAGLGVHLSESGRETVVQRRRAAKPDVAPALRIYPVYDSVPNVNERLPADTSRNLAQQLRQLSSYEIDGRLDEGPLLIVMTKWRLGTARQRTFHPDYLADAATMRLPVSSPLTRPMRDAKVKRAPATFQTARTSGSLRLPVTLYAAQTLALPVPAVARPRRDPARRSPPRTLGNARPPTAANGCDPVLWLGPDRYARTLLARCRSGSSTFHLLSDPDLLNNAGLAVGENAAFATALVNSLAADASVEGSSVESAGAAPVRVDLVDGLPNFREARRDRRGRSFSDLARFFAWPFGLVWGGLAVLVALALWRAALRFGPALVTRDRFHAASKRAVIDTNARILAAGTSGAAGGATAAAMLREHARYRMAGLARDLFGSNGSETALRRAVARRAPALAERLDRIVAGAATTPPARWIEEFEATLGGIEKEFGR